MADIDGDLVRKKGGDKACGCFGKSPAVRIHRGSPYGWIPSGDGQLIYREVPLYSRLFCGPRATFSRNVELGQ